MYRRYSSRNRPKKEKQKQKSTCLSCSVETNQNLIYKGAQTEERSLLEKRRGKKGRRKLGRQRVEKMMIVVLSPIPYGLFLFSGNHWCDPRILFFVSSSYDRCYRKCSLSVRHRHLRLTHTHSLTHTHICMYTYIFIYIYLSLSICRGGRTSCNARVSKASIVSTYQTANAMHTLLHHVKRALFFPFLFLFFFGELYLLPHGWGGKTGDSPGNKQSRVY